MRRLAVLAVVLMFVAFFAFLTVAAIAQQGRLTAGGVLSLFVLILLLVGVLGAFGSPRR